MFDSWSNGHRNPSAVLLYKGIHNNCSVPGFLYPVVYINTCRHIVPPESWGNVTKFWGTTCVKQTQQKYSLFKQALLDELTVETYASLVSPKHRYSTGVKDNFSMKLTKNDHWLQRYRRGIPFRETPEKYVTSWRCPNAMAFQYFLHLRRSRSDVCLRFLMMKNSRTYKTCCVTDGKLKLQLNSIAIPSITNVYMYFQTCIISIIPRITS